MPAAPTARIAAAVTSAARAPALSRCSTPATPPARTTPTPTAVSRASSFALTRYLIPAASATPPPPAVPSGACSSTLVRRLTAATLAHGSRACSVALPTHLVATGAASGTTRREAVLLQVRTPAWYLLPALTASATGRRVAERVLPIPMRLAAAAPAVRRLGGTAVRRVLTCLVTAPHGAFRFAHRVRPSTGRLTGFAPLSSIVSTRAALLCR